MHESAGAYDIYCHAVSNEVSIGFNNRVSNPVCCCLAEIKHLPGPALCSAVAFRLPSMVHTVKAVDVVPTVGCNDLIATTTKLDAGHKRRPIMATPLSGGHP